MAEINSVTEAVNLPFEEAIDWFREKDANYLTERYDDLTREEYQNGFAVAGIQNAQQLANMRQAVDSYIAEGKSIQDFRKDFDANVKKYGWSYNGSRGWRSQLIANQNAFSAYGAGRWEQINDPELMRIRPYREIRAGGSLEPNQEHAYLTGLVLPATDPFWEQLGPPPWDYGCKHQIVTLSKEEGEKKRVIAPPLIGLNRQFVRSNNRARQTDLVINAALISLPTALVASLLQSRLINQTEQQAKIQEVQQQFKQEAEQNNLLNPLLISAARTVGSAVLSTALAALKLNFKDPATALQQLFRVGVFNLAVSPVAGLLTAPLGPLSLPAQIALTGFGATEASRLFRKSIHKGIAAEVSSRLKPEVLDNVRLNLTTKPKTSQLTVIISGAGDNRAQSANVIAEALQRRGLQGQVIAAANPISTDESANPFQRVWSVLQQSFGVSGDSAEALINILNQGGQTKLNLLGYSAGAVVSEDLVGILAELGIPVDDVITWGGIGLPVNRLAQTRVHRYLSNQDQISIFGTIPDPSPDDRFFEGIYHGPEYVPASVGRRQRITQIWPGNRQVLESTAADFNLYLQPQPVAPTTVVPTPDLSVPVVVPDEIVPNAPLEPVRPELPIQVTPTDVPAPIVPVQPGAIQRVGVGAEEIGATLAKTYKQIRAVGLQAEDFVRALAPVVVSQSRRGLSDLATVIVAVSKDLGTEAIEVRDFLRIAVPDLIQRTQAGSKELAELIKEVAPKVRKSAQETMDFLELIAEEAQAALPKTPRIPAAPLEVLGVDLNTASKQAILDAVPYLNVTQVNLLKRWIAIAGPLESVDDLAKVPGISKKVAEQIKFARGLLDINNLVTGATELTQIRGITRTIANAIVAEIQTNGPFKSTQDLQKRLAKIKGIGPAKLRTLQSRLYVGPVRQQQSVQQPDVGFAEPDDQSVEIQEDPCLE